MLERGADINKTVNNKETALMIAARYNNNETLVSLGVDVNGKNSQGKTALDIAKTDNNKTAENALKSLMQIKQISLYSKE
ncbi:MAG: ankyrin repeat domain-containing protein [Methylococcaceae bacterium]|nr:ankyrin repeat domain-containing protein [Methylococcaceae bacterium]MDD1616983.1 ankyrin repeat domain-containing protein [Methylococcaceae bacterium]OYV16325.1 MAG: hypothetical protein CG439_2157 [Methylococcaceae bacterium NSP1-2]